MPRSSSTSDSRASPWSRRTCSSMASTCSSASSAARRMPWVSSSNARPRRLRRSRSARVRTICSGARRSCESSASSRSRKWWMRASRSVSTDSSAFWRAIRSSARLRSDTWRPSATMNATWPLAPRSGRSTRSTVSETVPPLPIISSTSSARQPAVGGQLDGAPQVGLHVLGVAAPRRLPQQMADHLVAVQARGGQRRVGDVEKAAVGAQERDEARGLGKGDLGHEAPGLGVGLRIGDLIQARLQGVLHVHRRAPGIESSLPHCGWFPSRAPSTIGENPLLREGTSLPLRAEVEVKTLAPR